MQGSPRLGLRAERSHPAVASVLTPCLPLGKYHLHLCGALMTVGTSSLSHHPGPCPTPVHGHPWGLLPPHSDLFTPLDLCTLPINSGTWMLWLTFGDEGGGVEAHPPAHWLGHIAVRCEIAAAVALKEVARSQHRPECPHGLVAAWSSSCAGWSRSPQSSGPSDCGGCPGFMLLGKGS